MLHRDILLPEANVLWDLLCGAAELKGLTLIGGTALALQIKHRISLDFDFAQFGGQLPCFAIDQLISRLKREGHQAQMITDQAKISQFKINHGSNLLDIARDYVINGVKVTFFVQNKSDAQNQFYQSTPKLTVPGASFDVLGIDGLKVSKTLVLADRIRSRDLYDLSVLMRDHGYTLDALFNVVKTLGTIDDPEFYKAIMRGEAPLDSEDEGLEAVDQSPGYDHMYTYFNQAIDEHETEASKKYFLEKRDFKPSDF